MVVVWGGGGGRGGEKWRGGVWGGPPYRARIGRAFKEKKLLEVKLRKTGETQQMKPSEIRQLFS